MPLLQQQSEFYFIHITQNSVAIFFATHAWSADKKKLRSTLTSTKRLLWEPVIFAVVFIYKVLSKPLIHAIWSILFSAKCSLEKKVFFVFIPFLCFLAAAIKSGTSRRFSVQKGPFVFRSIIYEKTQLYSCSKTYRVFLKAVKLSVLLQASFSARPPISLLIAETQTSTRSIRRLIRVRTLLLLPAPPTLSRNHYLLSNPDHFLRTDKITLITKTLTFLLPPVLMRYLTIVRIPQSLRILPTRTPPKIPRSRYQWCLDIIFQPDKVQFHTLVQL